MSIEPYFYKNHFGIEIIDITFLTVVIFRIEIVKKILSQKGGNVGLPTMLTIVLLNMAFDVKL